MDIYVNTETEIKIYRYIDTNLYRYRRVFSCRTFIDNVFHVWKEGPQGLCIHGCKHTHTFTEVSSTEICMKTNIKPMVFLMGCSHITSDISADIFGHSNEWRCFVKSQAQGNSTLAMIYDPGECLRSILMNTSKWHHTIIVAIRLLFMLHWCSSSRKNSRCFLLQRPGDPIQSKGNFPSKDVQR